MVSLGDLGQVRVSQARYVTKYGGVSYDRWCDGNHADFV